MGLKKETEKQNQPEEKQKRGGKKKLKISLPNLKIAIRIILVVAIVVAVIWLIVYLIWSYSSVKISTLGENDKLYDWDQKSRINIAIIVADEERSLYFVDYLSLLQIDKYNNSIKILDINPKFAPSYLSTEEYTLYQNYFAIKQSLGQEINMNDYLAQIEKIAGTSVEGYVFVTIDGFEKLFDNNKKIKVSAPSDLVDPDLPEYFSIEKQNKIELGKDFMYFMASDENGYKDKMSRQLSGARAFFEQVNLFNLAFKIIKEPNNVSQNIRSNLNKKDLIKIAYTLKYKKYEYSADFIEYHPGYVVDSSFGEVWRIVYETVNSNLINFYTNPKAKIEQARIDVLNGTSTSGMASVRSRWLTVRGLRITLTGNSLNSPDISQIYVENPELYPNTLYEIQETLYGDSEIIPAKYPGQSVGEIVVVLGKSEVRE